MDTLQAFAMGALNRGNESMVFDWDLAATLIKESGAKEASAGLRSDWEATGGTIWEDGNPVNADECYCYLASTWAVPEIEIDGNVTPCYKMQSETDDWGADTLWPDSALDILNS